MDYCQWHEIKVFEPNDIFKNIFYLKAKAPFICFLPPPLPPRNMVFYWKLGPVFLRGGPSQA
jgi:hypothetical protein